MIHFTSSPLCADSMVLDYISKSVSDHVGKVQVEKMVSRDGSTFIEKYWKNPDEGIAKDEVVIGGYHNLPKSHPDHPDNRTYKEFQSSGASNLYFGSSEKITLKSFGKWMSGLTDNMKSAVTMYTKGLDRLANGLLRGTSHDSYSADTMRKLHNAISTLEQALDRFELKDDIVVHRKASSSLLADFTKSPDGVWMDDGFTSTSTVKGSFSGHIDGGTIDIVIKVPKGKGRGAWVSPVSHFPHENEFLLNRGSMFKVTAIRGSTVEMTWVGRDARPLEMRKSISDDFIDLQPNPTKYIWQPGQIRRR